MDSPLYWIDKHIVDPAIILHCFAIHSEDYIKEIWVLLKLAHRVSTLRVWELRGANFKAFCYQ